jgi:hypothetical protein
VLGGYGEPLGKLELCILVPIPDTNGTRHLVQGLVLEKDVDPAFDLKNQTWFQSSFNLPRLEQMVNSLF